MSNDLIKLRKTEGLGIGGGTGSGGITLPAEPYEPGGWVAPGDGSGGVCFVVNPVVAVGGCFTMSPPGKPPAFNWPGTGLHSDYRTHRDDHT